MTNLEGREYPNVFQHMFERIHISDDECWEWVGSKTREGYGQMNHKAVRQRYTHRAMYELLVGRIPKGKVIDHLCRNTSCVNPDHLEVVTERENIFRGIGPTARNHLKAQCPSGHPYAGENLVIKKDGARRCRTCHIAGIAKSRAQKCPKN